MKSCRKLKQWRQCNACNASCLFAGCEPSPIPGHSIGPHSFRKHFPSSKLHCAEQRAEPERLFQPCFRVTVAKVNGQSECWRALVGAVSTGRCFYSVRVGIQVKPQAVQLMVNGSAQGLSSGSLALPLDTFQVLAQNLALSFQTGWVKTHETLNTTEMALWCCSRWQRGLEPEITFTKMPQPSMVWWSREQNWSCSSVGRGIVSLSAVNHSEICRLWASHVLYVKEDE